MRSHSIDFQECGAFFLSDCRFVIEPSGSGDIFADDSDLVCLHERYVDR